MSDAIPSRAATKFLEREGYSDRELEAMIVALCAFVPAGTAEAVAQQVLDDLWRAGWRIERL